MSTCVHAAACSPCCHRLVRIGSAAEIVGHHDADVDDALVLHHALVVLTARSAVLRRCTRRCARPHALHVLGGPLHAALGVLARHLVLGRLLLDVQA